VIHQRRIMVAALDCADRAVHGAVANLLAALQGCGHILQKLVAVGNAQRLGGAENRIHLFVREPDRGHELAHIYRRAIHGNRRSKASIDALTQGEAHERDDDVLAVP
jgi:hypothetical protein